MFLILDNLRVHRSKPVKAWLEKIKKKSNVFIFYQLVKKPALAGAFKILNTMSFIIRSVNMVLAESATVCLL